jgi:hypothetical protein
MLSLRACAAEAAQRRSARYASRQCRRREYAQARRATVRHERVRQQSAMRAAAAQQSHRLRRFDCRSFFDTTASTPTFFSRHFSFRRRHAAFSLFSLISAAVYCYALMPLLTPRFRRRF